MKAFDPTDFANPVVVKEMRQGLKSKRFLAIFLFLLVSMTTSMALALLPEDIEEMRQVSATAFWIVACACFLVLIPMIGINALWPEQKQGTLDLVMLTRITAWRLVFGKWTSLVLQTVLVATVLLPYLIVRHYIGGVDLALEGLLLIAMLAVSFVLSACMVFASSFQSWLVRFALGGAQLWIVASLPFLILAPGIRINVSLLFDDVTTLAMVVCFLFVILVFVLELAASRFAPISENHTFRKRIIALTTFFIAIATSSLIADQAFIVFACGLLYVTGVDACTDRFASIPTIYVPFIKFGVWGRIAGFFFYPGSVSATFFAISIAMAIPGGMAIARPHDLGTLLSMTMTIASTLLTPLAFARILHKRIRPSLVFLGFHTSAILFASVGAVALGVLDNKELSETLLGMVPTTAFFLIFTGRISEGNLALAILANTFIASIAFCYLLLGRAADWRALHEQERLAAEIVARRNA